MGKNERKQRDFRAEKGSPNGTKIVSLKLIQKIKQINTQTGISKQGKWGKTTRIFTNLTLQIF